MFNSTRFTSKEKIHLFKTSKNILKQLFWIQKLQYLKSKIWTFLGIAKHCIPVEHKYYLPFLRYKIIIFCHLRSQDNRPAKKPNPKTKHTKKTPPKPYPWKKILAEELIWEKNFYHSLCDSSSQIYIYVCLSFPSLPISTSLPLNRITALPLYAIRHVTQWYWRDGGDTSWTLPQYWSYCSPKAINPQHIPASLTPSIYKTLTDTASYQQNISLSIIHLFGEFVCFNNAEVLLWFWMTAVINT